MRREQITAHEFRGVTAVAPVTSLLPITGRLVAIIVTETEEQTLTIAGATTGHEYVKGLVAAGYHVIRKLAVDTDASALTVTGNIYAHQVIPGEKITVSTTAGTVNCTLIMES